MLFINGEVERLVGLWHLAGVVLQVEVLRFLQDRPDSRLAEVLYQRLALWKAPIGPEKRNPAVLGISFLN